MDKTTFRQLHADQSALAEQARATNNVSWIVVGGEALRYDPDEVEADWTNSMLCFAPSPTAALWLAREYDAGRLQPDNHGTNPTRKALVWRDL